MQALVNFFRFLTQSCKCTFPSGKLTTARPLFCVLIYWSTTTQSCMQQQGLIRHVTILSKDTLKGRPRYQHCRPRGARVPAIDALATSDVLRWRTQRSGARRPAWDASPFEGSLVGLWTHSKPWEHEPLLFDTCLCPLRELLRPFLRLEYGISQVGKLIVFLVFPSFFSSFS